VAGRQQPLMLKPWTAEGGSRSSNRQRRTGIAVVASNPAGLLPHLMRRVVASRIMRTTIDLDPSVLRELKHRSARSGKSMGQVASELLARSLDEPTGKPVDSPFRWIAKDLGVPRVDLEDKESVRAALESDK
jgi:hypothetical protein